MTKDSPASALNRTVWQAEEGDRTAILEARHGNPFAVLGPHETPAGLVIRAFVPGADALEVLDRNGAPLGTLARWQDTGFFEGLVALPDGRTSYRFQASNAGGTWVVEDPYAFGPCLGPTDDYLLVEGTHRNLYERLGAHVIVHEGQPGVRFALWAPHASRVSLVGSFNGWDGRCNPMRKRLDSGLWEIFMPHMGAGAVYKFEILGADGTLQPLKADPFGFSSELRPANASIVARTDNFTWSDQDYLEQRKNLNLRRTAISILEVHPGSWQRRDDGFFLDWDTLGDRLIPYAVWMGFTHLELMPVSEHPLDASWGYQPVGLFATTRRFGTPESFARFVDRAHGAGLGVILDWVPAHFPVDAHGLAHFDGAQLYEDANPQRGFHPDWNTGIYDFGRKEVANILIANALFWFDRYHIDGLRVDAVASMLYLDYSRKAGEWSPNLEGGNTNLEAVSFLRRTNELVYGMFPGAMMIAEESTSWPGVSQPVHTGGLGFGFKWNMGWMNDVLSYMLLDPVHRRFHHGNLTFGLLYAWSENFILPISHDEVVHGKGSMLAKMPGDRWQKFAGLRAFYGFMWGHPGKKLLFMGQEFAQDAEWNFNQGLDWHLADDPAHRGVMMVVRDLNHLMHQTPALHARDCEPEGFAWIEADDHDQSIVSFLRFDGQSQRTIAVICNFTPVPRHDYRIGLPHGGRWREVLNTDAFEYGGSGLGNKGEIWTQDHPAQGYSSSAQILVPPLAALYFLHDAEG